MGSQGMPAGVGGWGYGMSLGKESWERRPKLSFGDGDQRGKGKNRRSATDLGRRLGDWTWKNGEKIS